VVVILALVLLRVLCASLYIRSAIESIKRNPYPDLQASLEKAQRVGDETGGARAWRFLGEQAETRENLDEADRAYRRFLEFSEKLQLDNFMVAAYTQLAQVALKQKKDEESFGFLLEALRRYCPCRRPGADRDSAPVARQLLSGEGG
jgi:tetratricopeptide (TPR) repeat protein